MVVNGRRWSRRVSTRQAGVLAPSESRLDLLQGTLHLLILRTLQSAVLKMA
jgi:hypothetical protein